MLLRAIEVKRFLPVGTDREVESDFRDLNAATVRVATLPEGGRINEALVEEERKRLGDTWQPARRLADLPSLDDYLSPDAIEQLDRFDRAQLAFVLSVCRRSRSLSDAGRQIFDVSRLSRATTNDADRLGKQLRRFGLTWERIQGR